VVLGLLGLAGERVYFAETSLHEFRGVERRVLPEQVFKPVFRIELFLSVCRLCDTVGEAEKRISRLELKLIRPVFASFHETQNHPGRLQRSQFPIP